jgi:hypothetical protein
LYGLVEVLIMRAIVVLSVLAVAAGAAHVAGSAEAKGPSHTQVEISGGGLESPIMIGEPVPFAAVFQYDQFEAAPPERPEPEYTVKLTPAPEEEDVQYPTLTLSYYPGEGDQPALLRGHWGSADRYFRAGEAFEAELEGAIGAATAEEGGDGAGTIWYIAPGVAAVGLALVGGLAGLRRRLR